MTAWSYSSISTFKQCPKKYYHLKIAKDFKDSESDAMNYGKEVHSAAEQYIKSSTPVPAKFEFLKPWVEKFEALPGEKSTELKMGLRENKTPCSFFAKDVWWRGIADFLSVDDETNTAYSVDYKTSKNAKYADFKQLDLVAGAIFSYFPRVKKVKSALAFVVSGEFLPKEHVAEEKDKYHGVFDNELERLASAENSGIFNPIAGPLCGYCPVETCEHNRKR